MTLDDSVERIKGVGPETATKLKALNVMTIHDLLTYWPRRYDDYSEVLKISQMKPGTVTIKAKVESIKGRHVRRGMHITEAVLRDDSSAVRVVWFNQPYRLTYFKSDKEYYFSGLYDFSYNRYVLQNPTVEQAAEFTKNTARIVPIYRETKGLTSREIRQYIYECIGLFNDLPESLPKQVVKENKLLSYSKAAETMHWPKDQTELTKARRRIGFEEVFSYIVAGLLNKQENAKETALPIEFDQTLAKDYTKALPFTLTDAQKSAAWAILQDIAETTPMNRLLEGDVGSGKTVVAAFASFLAAKQGVQTAFMAPTELLARQHAKTLFDILDPLGIKHALLTSAVKKAAKDTLKAKLEAGEIDIVVGTHALLEENVTFHRLGLIVIDEQHRFGVAQRQKLIDKGAGIPHILSMTATPIPRSLALTIYGELDISLLKQKPLDRLPIKTVIWSPNSRPQLYDEIDEQLEQGRQAFVVCALIDSSDTTGQKSVTDELKRLQTGPFKHRRIGLLHGKLKDEAKAAVMQSFIDKELDILVSTTVIEVGIDIPNATVMLIEDADQFGLSQLHQLRGRVGRSHHQGFCYLMPSTSQKPSKRLRAMETTNDGFKLAELDLSLRGPGAVYGTRQHGKLDLKIANISDTDLIATARSSAKEFLKTEKLSNYPILKKRVDHNRNLTYLN